MRTRAHPAHIFISYSHADQAHMMQVRTILNNHGLATWTDEHLEPGTLSWKKEIERNIRSAGAMVAILTPSATTSIWCERERDYASAQGIEIFALLAEGDPKSAVPLDLISAQWVDIRNKSDFQTQMHGLINTLTDHLSKSGWEPLESPQAEGRPKTQSPGVLSTLLSRLRSSLPRNRPPSFPSPVRREGHAGSLTSLANRSWSVIGLSIGAIGLFSALFLLGDMYPWYFVAPSLLALILGVEHVRRQKWIRGGLFGLVALGWVTTNNHILFGSASTGGILFIVLVIGFGMIVGAVLVVWRVAEAFGGSGAG
jgi:hypothetical protein